jgi:hypothetical protein
MTLFGFLVLILIAGVVIHVNQTKSLPPPVEKQIEEPVEKPFEPEKSSRVIVVFWLFILMATIAVGLYGIWLNV